MKEIDFLDTPTADCWALRPLRPLRSSGFTLIEVMSVVAIVAILAAVALPSYQSYVKKSRAKGATADLMALSLVMENMFQKKLSYPVYASETTITRLDSWSPAQAANFSYSVLAADGKSYTLTAAGTGTMSDCTLTLTHENTRGGSCPVIGGAW